MLKLCILLIVARLQAEAESMQEINAKHNLTQLIANIKK